MNQTYQVYYLGCKTSQNDALGYAGFLQHAGWKEVVPGTSAGVIVVQTCTVTMSADAQARQLIRKLKREHPESRILLTGCYAQRAEGELKKLPEVDYVVGNLDPRRFEILSEIARTSYFEGHPDFLMPAESPRTRPYIKIQEGCDARCSYCIIPAVRGKSRSLPMEEVLRRVEYYRDRGYKEMIFTGISMGGYGKDLSPKTNLSQLMSRVDKIPGDFRIRLSSVEPEELDEEFIDIFTSSTRFQPHLHLPLQSASDRVLKKMRRQYLFRRYDSLVDRLFARLPDLNLGTDLLVGFPEEDRDAFGETFRYVAGAPFGYCHVFPFSPRPETPAAVYRPAATHQEISERAAKLRELGREKNLAYRRKFVGRVLRALLLHRVGEALTDNYIRVRVEQTSENAGIVYIRMNSVEDRSTSGVIVN